MVKYFQESQVFSSYMGNEWSSVFKKVKYFQEKSLFFKKSQCFSKSQDFLVIFSQEKSNIFKKSQIFSRNVQKVWSSFFKKVKYFQEKSIIFKKTKNVKCQLYSFPMFLEKCRKNFDFLGNFENFNISKPENDN